jgi:tetratricopeptide (TPR) repeat protein
MNFGKYNPWLLPVTLLLGFGGVWNVQHNIDAQTAALHQEQDDLVLRSGPLLKVMSLEYAPLLADIYWTRAVQYYGNKHARRDGNIVELWPLLDVTTTLDPHLVVAYRFGAMFLSDPAPQGAGRPDLAIELIQRGIRQNPEYWRFYQNLGFVYYFDLKDYQKAAAAFLEGSKNPDSQVWMKVLAARILEQGETRATSVFLWNEIYQSATDPAIKQNALTHLQLIRAEADCEQLNTLAAQYEKRTGRRPSNMRDLINAGLLTRAAVDPLGFVYSFDAQGKSQLNPVSPLFQQKPKLDKPL